MTIELTTAETIAALTKEVNSLNLNRLALLAYQDKLLTQIAQLEQAVVALTPDEDKKPRAKKSG